MAAPQSYDTDAPGPLPTGLGDRLRAARRLNGLKLDEAAQLTRLSVAYLSRLEHEHRQPSLPALLTLARAYHTTVAELLGEDIAGAEPVVRAAGAEPVEAHGWTYWRVGSPRRGMQALRVWVPPGRVDSPGRVHPGEEWLYVLAGQLRLNLDGATHLLVPGDVAHFDSGLAHRMESADAYLPVEFLMVHAAPSLVAFSPCLPAHA
jgi:quercetin dioxygenase-like cupin family protein